MTLLPAFRADASGTFLIGKPADGGLRSKPQNLIGGLPIGWREATL
jgi:hypothetical protein